MTFNAKPPKWAEALLKAFLRPGDFDTVASDLLEEYRASVHPARGRRLAGVWYVPVRQKGRVNATDQWNEPIPPIIK